MFIKEVNNIRNKNKSIASTVKKKSSKRYFFYNVYFKKHFHQYRHLFI